MKYIWVLLLLFNCNRFVANDCNECVITCNSDNEIIERRLSNRDEKECAQWAAWLAKQTYDATGKSCGCSFDVFPKPQD